MLFDNLYAKYYPRKKKKSRIAGWIIGGLALAALVPIVGKCDKKKKEWGIASLLIFVGCKPSVTNAGKRELTISLPGFPYIKSMCQSARAKCLAKKVMEAAEVADEFDGDECCGCDLIDDVEGNTEPEVVISQE